MVKQRMTSADVAGEVACLKQRLLGLRLANVYDINAKVYILKLAKSGADGDKVFLLLESGTRFHTVQVIRDKPDAPSNFTMKLRKHLRTRRLEDVRQLGVDRVVDFVFGTGDNTYHLILEMYAQGNVILTNHTYEVLTLLRSHRDDHRGLAIMARHPYPMHAVRLRQPLQLAELKEAVTPAANTDDTTAASTNKGKADKGAGAQLKNAIASLLPYGPAIAEHCVLQAQLQAGRVLTKQLLSDQELLSLHKSIQQLESWFASLEQSAPEGFISLAPKAGVRAKQESKQAEQQQQQPSEHQNGQQQPSDVVNQEYNPLCLAQYADASVLTFPTFDAALDEFYSKVADQRLDVAKVEAEKAALSRLDKIKADQGTRATALEAEAQESEHRAALIEYNLQAVDACIDAVNAAIATGMDWKDLERMIKDERKAGNPVAALIHSLQLDQNKATLLLSNFLDDDYEDKDESALTCPATKVPVDLGLSAYSNARVHHELRKKQLAKQAKTIAANEAALKAAEKKAALQLANLRNNATTAQVVRKSAWYERFHWFISSENYLVISGRDAQQNELIVKRYFRKGDVYVHAELHGASSTIVRNNDPAAPIPPLTLQQAGCACVCRSRAWDQKVVTSAYWVHHHQVSKAAPTGEYLPTGSFMIRGKKNYLPPQPLVFGFGFIFKLEDSCIGRHVGERAVKSVGDEDQSVTEGGAEMDEEDEDNGEAGLSQVDSVLL
eukprot:jgi/Chrzof1/10082/Cz04g26130.t1